VALIGRKYKNKNIKDVIYKVIKAATDPTLGGLIELSPNDGSRNIIVTYAELEAHYKDA